MDPQAKTFMFPPAAHRVLDAIESSGHEAWFVGGCVRDTFMGRPINDVDIATSAPWRTVAAVCADRSMRAYETGVKHGTVTIVCDDPETGTSEGFEVTTFRADAPTSQDSRHPDSVEFVSSIEEDLERRDFTINAMAWHPLRGLVDPYGGLSDITSKTLRTVGDPSRRFREDALRILRACRFSAQLGFAIDPRTYEAMLFRKHLLLLVSTERTTHELDLMLLGDFIHDALMATVDVLSVVLPELVAMKGFQQVTKYHVYDVLEHTAWAVQLAAPSRLVRWAALCHDMGKPAAAFFDKDGVEHFYGHAKISARLARGLMDRLLMSNSFKNAVVRLVSEHSNRFDPTPKAVKRVLARFDGDTELLRSYLALKRADALAHAPAYRSQAEAIERAEAVLDEILANGDAFTVKQLAMNGRDVQGLGIPPGPKIGRILQAALDAVIEGTVPNEKAALLEFAERLRPYDGKDSRRVGTIPQNPFNQANAKKDRSL